MLGFLFKLSSAATSAAGVTVRSSLLLFIPVFFALSFHVVSVGCIAEPAVSDKPAALEKFEAAAAREEPVSLSEGEAEEISEYFLRSTASGGGIDETTLRAVKGSQFLVGQLGSRWYQELLSTLKGGGSSAAVALRQFGSAALPADNDYLQQGLRVYLMIDQLERASRSGDVTAVGKLRAQQLKPAVADLLEGRAAAIYEQLAVQAASAGERVKTLEYLAAVSQGYRSQAGLELANQTLRNFVTQLSPDENILQVNWPFDREEILGLVKQVEKQDLGLQQLMAAVFAARVLYLMPRGDVVGARNYFLRVMERRPDPNQANDELRLNIALLASNEEGRHFAKSRLSELAGSPNVGVVSKFKLLMLGYYGEKFPVLLKCSIVFLLVIAVLYFVKPRFTLPTLPEYELPTGGRAGKAKSGRGYDRLIEDEDEYSKMLAVLGLDDSATEAQIKQAYRQLVKDCHPDSVGGSDPVKVARFQELKTTHDRVLEIRKSWFGR